MLLIAVVSLLVALALAAGVDPANLILGGCAMTTPLPDVAEVGADNVAHMAEAALIGAVLLLRGSDARAALDRVEVVDLGDPRHRAIWQALHSLRAAGFDPDPALVTPRLLALGLVSADRAGAGQRAASRPDRRVPDPRYLARVRRCGPALERPPDRGRGLHPRGAGDRGPRPSPPSCRS